MGQVVVSSAATSVAQYLDELEPDRRADVEQLLEVVRRSIQPGYEEAMAWGMICFQVPMSVSGPTYNNQPLANVAIAAQKNHLSIYLLGIYASKEQAQEFESRWVANGKKLNMGKSCVRFKKASDADLETIAWAASLLSPSEFVQMYQSARERKN